eukprot:TRINITY_DN28390_c0_g1_i1.p4 TRINITY_DN28390_c0_g1~~TRINITY_DN28390_c0_g1_i1.p4  ORF type:complete len:113 (-),score=32.05 TRINITY_DN28390_c0_g1_i1:729-1067(-)
MCVLKLLAIRRKNRILIPFSCWESSVQATVDDLTLFSETCFSVTIWWNLAPKVITNRDDINSTTHSMINWIRIEEIFDSIGSGLSPGDKRNTIDATPAKMMAASSETSPNNR